ncbi:MAG: hypothetical protein DMD50_09985 [Gemmatimonadetes bacterium]|nr:MAG: hypothetical protein DMD50_09985 [Gemmatimonadota bacterium]
MAAAVAALSATAVAAAQTGNGAPSGSHFNLNIIGVSHDKNPNMNGNGSGSVIFVDLGTRSGDAVTTKILLSQAADGVFEVLDKNGTDGEASFALPVPGTYTVWARALGTPGGQSKIATCATFIDPITGVATLLCSTENEVFVRGTGKSKFRDVTSALTTITLVAGSPAQLACGTPSVSLFATCLQDFLWQYDNNGLKLLQVRFYPS